MVKNTRSTDPNIVTLQRFLRRSAAECQAPIWKAAEKVLANSRSNRPEVNIKQINRISSENDTILILGKVLGSGTLNHPVKVAALNFSMSARSKIEKAGGECLSLPQLIEINPKGSGVQIIK